MRDWKPGDVAMVTWRRRRTVDPNVEVLALRTQHDEWLADGITLDENSDARPLAVIDPENDAHVGRLRDILTTGEVADELPNWKAALREFATPTAPKPGEPQGLGAVVEDAEGCDWHRTATGRWIREDGLRCTAGGWTHVAAVRVLSEGVPS